MGVTMGFLKKFTNRLTAPDVNVQLRFSSYSVVLGDNLQGSLNVNSKEDFPATEVRCEIACTEQAKVIREVYDATLKRSIPQVVDESVVIYVQNLYFLGRHSLQTAKPESSQSA
jgi:hypothetical protein